MAWQNSSLQVLALNALPTRYTWYWGHLEVVSFEGSFFNIFNLSDFILQLLFMNEAWSDIEKSKAFGCWKYNFSFLYTMETYGVDMNPMGHIQHFRGFLVFHCGNVPILLNQCSIAWHYLGFWYFAVIVSAAINFLIRASLCIYPIISKSRIYCV